MKLKWTEHKDLAIKRNESINHEEYLDYMTFKKNDRTLYTEIFGPLIGLKEEWEKQGATEAELDFSAFEFRSPKKHSIGVNTGCCAPAGKILEDTGEHTITIDGLGRRMKLIKGYATIPLPETFPVKNMDDWLKVKHFYEFNEDRVSGKWLENAKNARDNGFALQVSIPGGFDTPRQLFGEEMICYAVYDYPEVIHDILKTCAETSLKVFEIITSKIDLDILFVHEDMAGKSGPLWGPNSIEEFIKPYYLSCWNFLKEHGTRVFDQDSDGNMNPVIDIFLECGVNCMHPMEPAANMDIVKIRKKYGNRLAFYGGIDKHVLKRSKDEIVSELEYKVPAMVKSGGCVLALDHRIPNGIPLENYKFYLKTLKDIISREENLLK